MLFNDLGPTPSPRLQSEGNVADFDDAMDIIGELWRKVHVECVFSEDSPTGQDPESLNLPHIVYDLNERVHSEAFKTGNKPKTMKILQDPENPGHNLIEVSEWFDCEVDFIIYGASRNEAKIWTKHLENFLLAYVAFFRQTGIQDVIFMKESKNMVSTEYRQDLPHRRLRYLVRIQRAQTLRTIRLDDIDVRVVKEDPAHPGSVSEVYPATEFMDLYNKKLR